MVFMDIYSFCEVFMLWFWCWFSSLETVFYKITINQQRANFTFCF